MRMAVCAQLILYLRYYIALAVGAFEAAVAIGEFTLRIIKRLLCQTTAIQRAHCADRVFDFLAIGADVLDGCGPDETGYAGEALDAGQTAPDGLYDEMVPVFTGGNGGRGAIKFDAAQLDVQHEAIVAASEKKTLLPPPNTCTGKR